MHNFSSVITSKVCGVEESQSALKRAGYPVNARPHLKFELG